MSPRPSEIPEAEFAHLLSPLSLAITASDGTPQPYQYAPHLHHLSNKIVELVSRPAGGKRRLLVTMPPRHGKSELCSHWTPVWCLALDPTNKVVLASYEANYAASWGRKARRSVMEHYPLLGSRVLDDSRAANRWETSHGGGMVTAQVNGKIELVSLKIDPEVVDPDDVDMLQDLIIAAVSQANEKAHALADREMSKVTGGLSLPGMM